MKNIDYAYICTTIGNLASIPIRIFKDEERIFYHSLVSLPKGPMNTYRTEIFSFRSHIGYFITPSFHYYGIVTSGQYRMAIVPSIQIRVNDGELKKLAFECDVSAEDTDDFVAGMRSIILLPLNSVLQILCTMNYIMNEEKLGIKDITILDAE